MPSLRRPKATKLATTRMGITDTEPTPWVGVVLAGGRSSRMGRDKARLAWRDQSLLAHACATLQAAGTCEVVVSGDYPEYAGIPDALPALGPLGGLASVVDALPDGVLLLVPVDMPLLTPELLTNVQFKDAYELDETMYYVEDVARFGRFIADLTLRLDRTAP